MIWQPLNHLPGLLIVLGNRQHPSNKSTILLHILVLSQTILTLHLHTNKSNSNIAKESKLHLAILLRLALALGSGETGRETLREYLKETLVYIRLEVRRSSRLWTTWTQTSNRYGTPTVSKKETATPRSGLCLSTRPETTYSMARMPPLPYMSN